MYKIKTDFEIWVLGLVKFVLVNVLCPLAGQISAIHIQILADPATSPSKFTYKQYLSVTP